MYRTDGLPLNRTALIASAFVVFWAAGIGLIHYYAGSARQGSPEGAYASVAIAIPFVVVAVLGVLGAFGRRWFVSAAGFALLPMTVLTFSPAGLPFALPAFLLVRNGLAAGTNWPRGAAFLAVFSGILAVAAFAALFAHDDPVTWSSGSTSYASSDIITRTEAAISMSLAAAALLVAAISCRVRRQR